MTDNLHHGGRFVYRIKIMIIFYRNSNKKYKYNRTTCLIRLVNIFSNLIGNAFKNLFVNQRATETYRNKILKLYECPLRLVRWCVISDFEKDKCRLMRNAFASRNIKPDLDCVSADNAWECMLMIKNRLADLITLDPADAYRASRYFGLVPLASEDYGTMTDKPVYYAVAVVKRTDLSTNLWNLRTKIACGTAMGDLAGWHVPVDYLIAIKELYVTDCHVPKAAGEYFGRSCIPGSKDYDYNTLETNPRALCLECYSKGSDFCSRSHREYFYGDTGAFRCLNEGGGDVAFVRHTSVQANTDGRNTDQWARPLRKTDFELLCKDGTRQSVDDYETCHLMKVPSRLVMIGGHRTFIQRSYLWNMLNFAQQLFGSDTSSSNKNNCDSSKSS
ncbi:family S60 non peptidase ue S60 family [Brachionus plicatilis]|uniref:Family S60 non peptidase ue S60 family n=1 Tax=Brachionus plicatilis TaxID=10195 RepID=A0A3M7QSB4_BRAPC|nr:family S60 non peptidase ue S60 family [Brachionus plicatilis]